MKRSILYPLVLVVSIAFMVPAGAYAAKTVEGWIQGLNCVRYGHNCPIDRLDPHLMFEPDFVLLLKDGDYWLMPNVARIVKAKYVHKTIRVTGNTDAKFKSIEVDKLEVKDGGSYKTIWSKAMMKKEWQKRQEEFYGEGGG